jgi:hypothetical protein
MPTYLPYPDHASTVPVPFGPFLVLNGCNRSSSPGT